MKKVLVVVDYQNDFVEGALGFDKAKILEDGIKKRVLSTLKDGGYVFFTLDTHGDDYLYTREGKFLPVLHCIKGTPGHKLYGSISELTAHKNTKTVEKSRFGAETLAHEIKKVLEAPDVISLCGVVTNMCVISNAVLLQTAFENTEIEIIEPLCASFDENLHREAIDVMRSLQMHITE